MSVIRLERGFLQVTSETLWKRWRKKTPTNIRSLQVCQVFHCSSSLWKSQILHINTWCPAVPLNANLVSWSKDFSRSSNASKILHTFSVGRSWYFEHFCLSSIKSSKEHFSTNNNFIAIFLSICCTVIKFVSPALTNRALTSGWCFPG